MVEEEEEVEWGAGTPFHLKLRLEEPLTVLGWITNPSNIFGCPNRDEQQRGLWKQRPPWLRVSGGDVFLH